MTRETVQPYRPLELMLDETMTSVEFTDFIGVWDKFVPGSFCDEMIEWFEAMTSRGTCSINIEELDEMFHENDLSYQESTGGAVRGEVQYGSNMTRKDSSILVNYTNDRITYQINQFLKSCLMHYITEFGQLKNVPMFSSDIKMQKTKPGGGYHSWHYENSSASHAARELTWMIYLNDVKPENGGETEFMYQHRRFNPTRGTVMMFPCGMTHVHRGNTVLDGDKYILTGWYIKSGA
jgi:hypothetical protein